MGYRKPANDCKFCVKAMPFCDHYHDDGDEVRIVFRNGRKISIQELCGEYVTEVYLSADEIDEDIPDSERDDRVHHEYHDDLDIEYILHRIRHTLFKTESLTDVGEIAKDPLVEDMMTCIAESADGAEDKWTRGGDPLYHSLDDFARSRAGGEL